MQSFFLILQQIADIVTTDLKGYSYGKIDDICLSRMNNACTATGVLVGGGVHSGSTRHVGHWMAYFTCPARLWWWRIWWNEDWQGDPKYSEKTCPSATLSTTNPTWPDPGSNPGRRCGKLELWRGLAGVQICGIHESYSPNSYTKTNKTLVFLNTVTSSGCHKKESSSHGRL
jgi:hypothetical protein